MFCLQADLLPENVAVVNTKELLDIHEKEAMEYIQKMESIARCYFYCGTITSKKEIGQ
jgi:hypothetical protein